MSTFKTRNGSWGWRTRTPPRPVQRCGCRTLHWVEVRPIASCRRCGAELGPPTLERRQVVREGFRTRRSAAEAERDFLSLIDRGRDPLPVHMTVTEFALNWLRSPRVQGLATSTVRKYEDAITIRVLPGIGDLQIASVRARHVRGMRDDLLALGLKPRTVSGVLGAASSMFSAAVEDELIETNPCRGVRRPKAARPDDVIPTPRDLNALIAAAAKTPWSVPITLSATTGLRRGEVLGLRWSDIDLHGGRLTVANQLVRAPRGDGTRELTLRPPKSERSRRTITLPAVAVEQLRGHRRAQAERRLRLGSAWKTADFVCDRGDGGPLDPDAYGKAVKRIGGEVGLDGLKVHSLRHAGATLLLEQGVPMAIVSKVLGHSTIQLTVDTYGHLADTLTAQAADAVDRALGSAAVDEAGR